MRGCSAHRPEARRNCAALLLLTCALAGCGGGGGETVKAWSDPERISFANGNVSAPEVAVDASGNATAAFRDHDSMNWIIAANRFVPGNSWGSPQSISTTPSTSAIGGVDVATGPTGEAVVVWTQEPSDITNDSAWANTWTPGAGWGTPGLLDNTAVNVTGARVALDASGAGTAVWREVAPAPDTDDVLRGRPYSPGTGWGSQFVIPLLQATRIQSVPVIAAQPNGRAYVAFSQVVGSGISLFASWSDDRPPSIWQTELVDALSPPALGADIAVNASGTTFLVWEQVEEDGGLGLSKIWARRRPDSDQLNAWQPPMPDDAVRLDVDTGRDAGFSRVAVDDAGNAMAVWEQGDSGPPFASSIWANRYVAGSGWGAAQPLETASGIAKSPRIAMAPGGEAFAVWTQEDAGGNPRVWAAHFLPGSGWEAPVRLENDTGKNAFSPTVAIDGSGNAFAVWALSDPALSGVSRTWASQYR